MQAWIAALIRRPVGVTAFYLLVLALAAAAVVRLPVALLPSLQYPSLVIWTGYPDVAPEQVERSVTELIEEVVAGTEGISGITSRSQLGGSLVRLDFGWNTDLDLAILEVREKLDRLAGALPDRAERPLVLRIDPSNRPVLVLALGSAERERDGAPAEDLVQIKQVAREVVARRLEQLDGVARVRVTGGHEPEIDVEVMPALASAYGIDLEQISRALQETNVALSGGVVRRGPFRYSVEVTGEFRSADEVAETVVSDPGRPAVRLHEVARVREGASRRRGLVRLNGEEVLLLLVERQPDANVVETADAVRGALLELRAQLPGVRVEPIVDESVFIEAAIAGVAQALMSGAFLTIAVLFLFLRRPRAIVAAAVAVPLSLALTLVLFDLLGITFNLISLSGLALGVGLLLDNSTVVTENIARLREAGMHARGAACRGTAEVAGAITASTLTTVAVFLPITFIEGLAGRLFRDQSLAIVCSVLASLFVALTAVPLIVSRDRMAGSDARDSSGGAVLRVYEALLEWCIRQRGITLAATGVLLVAAAVVAGRLPRDTVPEAEEGRIEVTLTLPTDSDLDLVSERARVVEAAAADWSEVDHVLSDLAERDDARLDLDPRPPYRGDLMLVLAPGARSEDLLRRLRELRLPPDLTLEARAVRPQLESLLTADGADLSIDLVSGSRSDAERAVEPLLQALRSRPELANVSRAYPQGLPAYRLRLDHEAIARLSARPAVFDTYLEAAAQGRETTQLHSINDDIPIVLHAQGVGSIEQLLAYRVPAGRGLAPLSLFVRPEATSVPAVLLRNSRIPVLRLSTDISDGATLQEALGSIQEAEQSAALPPSVTIKTGGSSEAFRRTLAAVGKSLLLSILLVYLILAAQFESFLQPIVILAAVPLAAIGVVFSLALTGQSWNLMTLTACVVVIGIVDNDAIVKVDFINQARRQGLSLEDAVRAAGRNRFRPIVMNTLTTAMGLLPLAFGMGLGGELQAPLAITIVGGLLSATFLTLITVPVIYMSISRSRSPLP